MLSGYLYYSSFGASAIQTYLLGSLFKYPIINLFKFLTLGDLNSPSILVWCTLFLALEYILHLSNDQNLHHLKPY